MQTFTFAAFGASQMFIKINPIAGCSFSRFARLPWRSLFFVLILAAMAGLASNGALAQSQPLSFSQLSQQASAAWNARNYEKAAVLYGKAVKERPSWAEGWGYLASSLFRLNRYAEARKAYRHTTILTPDNGPSWAFLGLCDFELRDYRSAFDHLTKSRRLGLGNVQGLNSNVTYHMALLWSTAGQFELGIKEAAFLADQGDDSPAVVEATGLAVLRMPIFPYEVPAGKHDVVMTAGKAGWAQNAHHNEDAKQFYEELVSTYPNELNVHFAYAAFLAAQNQEAAAAEYEKEIQVNPLSVPARVQAAFLYLKMGELEKAEAHAQRATEIDPKNYAPRYLLGRVLTEMDRPADSIHELEIAARLSPSNANVHLSLAQAFQRIGKTQLAEQEMRVFKNLDEARKKQESELRVR
jgi:tetratricopeptide (TPR) repeat protein